MKQVTTYFLYAFAASFFVITSGLFGVLEIYTVQAATTTAKTTTGVSTKSIALEFSGWIPYWRKATGTADVLKHLSTFKEINPFGYTVKKNGTLFDPMGITNEPWTSLFVAARSKKIRIIPTVMWANGDAIEYILSNKTRRTAHIRAIVDEIKAQGFSGVDIDYEGKKASTRPYFSLFLKELSKALGNKYLMCTIEARTPEKDRFDTIPKDLEYANDFKVINTYCDRVRIMAYDQGSIDLRLNEIKTGPYIPVADIRWVEKVIRLTMKSIDKKKIVIGVPTYGYEYVVTPLAEGYRYDMLWAFNQRYGIELAQSLGINPTRNAAGELSLIYTPTSTAAITAYAKDTDETATSSTLTSGANSSSIAPQKQHILWWSDAIAIRDKVTLAKRLGVRGIAVFKLDGGVDPALYEVLK